MWKFQITYFLLCALLVVIRTGAVETGSQRWTVQDFLEKEQYQRDERQPHGCLLVDPDSTLTQPELLHLRRSCLRASLLGSPFQQTSCTYHNSTGFQVVILILRQIADDEISVFAEAVYKAWNIRQSICNDGVLFLISVEDREVAFVSGEETDNPPFKERHDEVVVGMKEQLQSGQLVNSVLIGIEGLSPDDQPPFLLVTLIVIMAIGVVLRTMIKDPHSFRWPIRRPVKVKTHQDRVNNYVDINTDGFLPGLGHQPIDGQDTCAICLNPFVSNGKFSGIRRLWNLLIHRHEQGHLSSRAATLRCGHSCCNSCLRRWLGTNRQCPLCRRTVSEVSSEGPGSDFNGFHIPSNSPGSTGARLTFGDSPAMFRSQFSRPEVNSFISPMSERRQSRYGSRRRTRERSIDSYNSWTSGDMSD